MRSPLRSSARGLFRSHDRAHTACLKNLFQRPQSRLQGRVSKPWVVHKAHRSKGPNHPKERGDTIRMCFRARPIIVLLIVENNRKFIGEIPGYPVGSRFMNRNELSGTGVHAPLRAGIHGAKVDGAYSVVLWVEHLQLHWGDVMCWDDFFFSSYGYEDDEDYGETLYVLHRDHHSKNVGWFVAVSIQARVTLFSWFLLLLSFYPRTCTGGRVTDSSRIKQMQGKEVSKRIVAWEGDF